MRNRQQGAHSFARDLLDLGDDHGGQQHGHGRVQQQTAPLRQVRPSDLVTDDPLTDPSGDEDDEGACLQMVYRRDQLGRKYRA